MKKKWFGIRMGIALSAAFGWWGLLYPELALTPDSVRVISEETGSDAGRECEGWRFGGGLYWDILTAGPGKVTFRSRLLTDFSAILEAFHDRDK